MSMSTWIVGVRDLDERFEKMLAVKVACDEAQIDYPQEVSNYFSKVDEFEFKDEAGLRHEMAEIDIPKEIIREFSPNECVDMLEVDLSQLSPEVKAIRFAQSY